jgi:quercetin dioxygenase-like cupin family protein
MRTAFERETAPGLFSRHRGDGIKFQRLLTGPRGRGDTFELSIIHIAEGYSTPRHHHNFDQLRLGLRGTFNYARGKDIGAGDVLYVPEGTWYGPHRNEGAAEVMLIQYGGNSGSGFLTYDELAEGFQRLESRGSFTNGIYRPASAGDPEGTRNQDGYEAIWEEIRGVSVTYPAPRYHEPILIHPSAFDWVPLPEAPEVREKNLGVFGERRNEVRLLDLATGATLKAGTPGSVELWFVVEGQVRAGDARLGARDALCMEPDDGRLEVTALTAATVFCTVLPGFG